MNQSNSSLNYTQWWTKKQYAGLSVMFVQGFGLTSTNLPLILTILYHKTLRDRKEYLVILGVAIADGLTGFGVLSLCITVLHGFVTGLAAYPFTHHQCLTSLQLQLMTTGMSAQGWMLVAQSVDRLLAIAKPVTYFHFTTRYAWNLICFVFACVIGQSVIFTCISWGDQTVVIRDLCISQHALSQGVYTFWNQTHLACGCFGVFLYAVVMMLYWHHQKKVVPSGMLNAANESQRKVTLSMAISCSFTLMLFVLPRLFNHLMIRFDNQNATSFVRALSFILYHVNSMLNLFIYVKRQKEIRVGLVYLFKRKVLPPLENIGTKIEPKKKVMTKRMVMVMPKCQQNQDPDV